MRLWILVSALAVLSMQAWAQDAKKAEQLLADGTAAEARGDGQAAVKAYMGAARNGSAQAARRLSRIYEKGELGVRSDDVESLKWANFARTLGEKSEGGWGCPPNCAK